MGPRSLLRAFAALFGFSIFILIYHHVMLSAIDEDTFEVRMIVANQRAIANTGPNNTKIAFDCKRIFAADSAHIKQIAQNRPVMKKDHEFSLNMSCKAIQKRVYSSERNSNTQFPIAFIRLVHKDYVFLEQQLAMSYATENWFCFAIDKNASKAFRQSIIELSKCLPRVLLASGSYALDASGKNKINARMDCMRKLREADWKYAIILENHDVITKTSVELAAILSMMAGASDIEIGPCLGNECPEKAVLDNLPAVTHCSKSANSSKVHCANVKLTWARGASQMVLSKPTVLFIIDGIRTQKLIDGFNALNMSRGLDEMFIPSLAVTPDIDFPGGFHTKCFPATTRFITTKVLRRWRMKTVAKNQCTGELCAYGIEQLVQVPNMPELTIRMQPDYDYAAITCVSELLALRRLGLRDRFKGYEYYSDLPMGSHSGGSYPGGTYIGILGDLPMRRYFLRNRTANVSLSRSDCR